MPNGYHGKILHVDLTTGQLEIEAPDEAFYRHYMGGSALGTYYLLKNTPAGADPLGPENTLVLSLSVLTGAPMSGQSRMTATAKSPLTDAIGDAQCGGFWPAECKFAGFDAIVVKGKSDKPVYLWVHDGEAELRDASHLWGKLTGDAEALIREELEDEKIEVAQCGPAGENLVRYGAIMNMSNRANGRTGMGAVMGSKNLKAVAVRGKNRPQLADRKAVLETAKWGADNYEDSDVYSLGLLGTAGVLSSQHKAGGLPTHNWDSGVFEGYEAIDGQTLYDTLLKERDTCYACTVRCKRVVESSAEPYKLDPLYGGPEYESLATLGSYCGVDDLAAVSYANELCNAYGMDTVSCGATVAWAMNCFEQGLITTEDTGGIELRYGDAAAMVEMIELIGKREGLGDLLAEGSARAAEKVGNGAEDLVVTVKKQELPAHMPQVKRSLALIYAVNPFGADHMSHEHDPSYAAYPERMAELGLTDPQPDRVLNTEKVRFALQTQYIYSCLDTVNLCQFVYGPAWQLYGPSQMVEAVQAVTGWDVDLSELMTAGERRLNLMRAFNAREGIDRDADKLPKKLSKALVGGASDGVTVTADEVEKAKDTYYAMAGWDVATGTPKRDKLEELGLAWVADELGV
jgi:aldehyde:ferredoxin oxidoreductase